MACVELLFIENHARNHMKNPSIFFFSTDREEDFEQQKKNQRKNIKFTSEQIHKPVFYLDTFIRNK